jgi:diamine N-acetyltransferase
MEPTAAPTEAPILNIVGEKVALGPHRKDLLPLYGRWVNDFAVSYTLSRVRPYTLEQEEEWYAGANTNKAAVGFTAYERATLRPIGTAGLHKIDYINSTAEFGIVIGERDCWGQGYGTEITRLTLDYGFTGLNLHSILLEVFSFNERAIRAYTRAGFRMIGRRREAHRLGGQFQDVVLMDCLASEFESPVLKQIMAGS